MSLDFPTPPEWTERAACADTDTSVFFPGDGERGTAAKKICAECPVIDMCLEYALSMNDRNGIWGGMSSRERDQIRRRRNPETEPAHGTERGYRQHRTRGEKACKECLKAKSLASTERKRRSTAAA
jgi:WhiB family redox-sensing transcriptional regulator